MRFLDTYILGVRVKRQTGYKLAVVVCIIIYAWLVFQFFAQNLILDTDYPFHTHTIWAASNGHLLVNPFINGGNYLTLVYGGPAILVGGLLYPIAGIYTVAILLAIAVPALWYLSRRVFECLTNKKTARLAATIVLLNPFTVYYFLTAKLPFLWAICFALASVFLYLRGRNLFASLAGVLAVVTHPLAIFLLGALLLLNHNVKRWLKPFFLPLSITFIQLSLFFKPIGWSMGTLPIVNIFIFAAVMGAVFWLKREAWPFCVLGLFVSAIAIVTGFLRLPTLPTAYFDRIAFLTVLLLIPLAIGKMGCLAPFAIGKMKYAFPSLFLVPMTLGVVYAYAAPAIDNPEVYRGLPEPLLENLKGGYVRYVSDGSALYELPKLGIKFSNSGQEMFEVENIDPVTYTRRLKNDNVSHIIVYGEPPDEDSIYGWYIEEKIIQELGYPLIYSADNLRIYAVPRQSGVSYG